MFKLAYITCSELGCFLQISGLSLFFFLKSFDIWWNQKRIRHLKCSLQYNWHKILWKLLLFPRHEGILMYYYYWSSKRLKQSESNSEALFFYSLTPGLLGWLILHWTPGKVLRSKANIVIMATSPTECPFHGVE